MTPSFLAATAPASKGLTTKTVLTILLVVVAIAVAAKLFRKTEGYDDFTAAPIDESQRWKNASPADFATPTPVLTQPPPLSTADYPTASPESSALSGSMDLAYADSASPLNAGTQVQCNPVSSVATDLLPNAETTSDEFGQYAPKALQGQNFLDASQYIGSDTQGSSMKISSYDIRNVIPNPKTNVGPWNQSTYTADPFRRPLE